MTKKETQAESLLSALESSAPPSDDSAMDAVDRILFGPSMGRPTKEGPSFEIVRPLSAEDVALVEAGVERDGPKPLPTLKTIGARHHSLAQRLAQGMSAEDVSLMTGYTPQYIRQLKHDPAFQELLSYYATQAETKFVDVLERMKTLGIASVEELQKRLDEKPEDFAPGTLLQLADTMLLKPIAAAAQMKAAENSSAPAKLQIEFVSAKSEPKIIEGTSK